MVPDDGTSGLRQAADATLRQEIEKFSHIIFASSEAQREFWRGERAPALMSCGRATTVASPVFTAATRTTRLQLASHRRSLLLDQGCANFRLASSGVHRSGSRAYVGPEPPRQRIAVASHIAGEITDAPWAVTPTVPLNSGLVAIVGARGSGKTALADVIAAGCDAISSVAWARTKVLAPRSWYEHGS